jgi:acetylornithine deacetylase/succinyl-diaminopimelate desuccinylase-like protein
MNDEMKSQLDQYVEFLKMPSISAHHRHIRETAKFLSNMLNKNGIESQILETDGHPVVFGKYDAGKQKTLLVYNHYDVQPVDPLDEWNSDPFSAEIKANRVYARGSSDNKGTLMARIFGIVRAVQNNELNLNLKFLYEGEEEIGSPSLENFIENHHELLKSDSVIMEGSTVGVEGRPVISLGVKGLVYAELRDEVSSSDMHSSNAAIAPNSAWNIILALGKLYDGSNVRIPGFYENVRPLTEKEKKIISEYPFSIEEFKESFGLKYLRYDNREDLVNALFGNPTFNVDGIISGYTGEGSKTVTPRKAMAKVDFRLVPDQDPKEIFKLFEKSVRESGFRGEIIPMGLEYPVRTSPESPLARSMIDSARKVYGKEPIVMINSPGTQPMALFTRNLGIKEAVSAIGVGDQQSGAHAPNESVNIDNFFRAVEHTYSFLKEYR